MSNIIDVHLNIQLFAGPVLLAAHSFQKSRRLVTLNVEKVEGPDDLVRGHFGILILDHDLLAQCPDFSQWRNLFGGRLFIIAPADSAPDEEITDQESHCKADAWISETKPGPVLQSTVENAIRQLHLEHGQARLHQELALEHEKLSQLSHIGLALSAERNLNRLLTMILAEGRNWGCCDAASLFLVEANEHDEPELVFKLTQNDSISFPFVETRFPLDKTSIAGFAAVTGEVVNIPDVYHIPANTPFSFNSSFDETIHYRTRSLLTIPMKNHNDEVIGVLQFINRKTDHQLKLTNREVTEKHTLPFSEDITVLLKALASQAAVAIGNNILISRVQDLFEGFVTAAVTAIEQRDPTTSGHSFRVAELTTSLAVVLPRSEKPRLKPVRFDHHELTEIRYASLLHDFGKVGVKEGVLTKAKKLPNDRLDLIWHRFSLLKEQLRREAADFKAKVLAEEGLRAFNARESEWRTALQAELDRLDRLFDDIARANEPTVLPAGTFNHLEAARDWPAFKAEDRFIQLLTEEEFLALSIRRGTLTQSERLEIESHVVHTFNFLRQIPWTNELKRIPEIAVAHHEKLDGSGYPFGMNEDEIPLASRMMTIADIFDALTAADRPYKRSLQADDALDILVAEGRRGLLDTDLVDVFIEAKVYESILEPQDEPSGGSAAHGHGHQRHVCDFDIANRRKEANK